MSTTIDVCGILSTKPRYGFNQGVNVEKCTHPIYDVLPVVSSHVETVVLMSRIKEK